MVGALGVVGGQAAVEADADAYAVPGEGGGAGLGEKGRVGLDGGVDGAAGGCQVAYPVGEGGQPAGTGEKGFAAVQDECDVAQAVGRRVLGDAVSGAVEDGGCGGGRAVAPGAVGARVEVAVAAGEIAAAVHLDDELPEGGPESVVPGTWGRFRRRFSRHSRTPVPFASAARPPSPPRGEYPWLAAGTNPCPVTMSCSSGPRTEIVRPRHRPPGAGPRGDGGAALRRSC